MQSRKKEPEPSEVLQRRCSKCGEKKPLDAVHFYRNGDQAGGFNYCCRTCQREVAAIRRRKEGIKERARPMRKPPRMPKACSRCGQSFQPKSTRHKYCGTQRDVGSCSWKASREAKNAAANNNRDKTNARYRERYATRYRAKAYGISESYLVAMYADHQGKCGICKTAPAKRGLMIDHCHATGRVRGLLCVKCNWQLGHLEAEWYSNAMEYLRTVSERSKKWIAAA